MHTRARARLYAHISVRIPTRMSVHNSIRMSTRMSIHISIHISIRMSVPGVDAAAAAKLRAQSRMSSNGVCALATFCNTCVQHVYRCTERGDLD